MSSLTRRIQRKWKRVLPDYEPPKQVVKLREDSGYDVLHPTKGWRSVSAKRVKANGIS